MTEIERRQVAVNLGGPITDLDQAMRAADILSRSDLLPYALRGNAPNTLLVMLTGQELGLSLTQAFRTIYVPSGGQPQLRGVLALAKLRLAGHSYKFEETDDSCKFTVIRGDTGEEFEGSFTVEDAITAKLAKRGPDGGIVALSEKGKELPWMLYKRDLLQWRAVARGAQRGAPEVMLGFEIAGAVPPEPKEDVQLKPEAPAPPGPAGQPSDGSSVGQAATGDGQAVQAELAELDAKIRQAGEATAQAVASAEEHFTPEAVEQAVALAEEISQVGGIPEGGGESAPEPETDPTASARATASPATTGSGDTAPAPVDEPVDAAGNPRNTVALAKWFADFGYDPKLFRGRVLNACSVFTRRRIKGVRDMKAAEVIRMCSKLEALWKDADKSELAPVSLLADKIGEWQDAWEREEPDTYAEYTGP